MFKFITSGLSLQEPLKVINKSDLECFKLALDAKLQGEYSDKYKSMLRFVYDSFTSKLSNENIASNDVKSYLNHYALGVSYNTIKRHLSVLINEARNIGMNSNPMEGLKQRKQRLNYINLTMILGSYLTR